MISREQTSNLVKLAILVMINLCIIYFAFSQSPSSTMVSAEKSTIDVVSQYGSQSDEVTQIQTRLKSWGYFSGPVTGYYGSQTTEAIKNFSKLTDFPLLELPMKNTGTDWTSFFLLIFRFRVQF